MRKRGPKPVDIGALLAWEHQWYWQFRLLRDGAPGGTVDEPEWTIENGKLKLLKMRPRQLRGRLARRDLWNALIRARTVQSVRQACERWKRLPDVRAAGTTPFPDYVVAYAKQFLFMKRNPRFPRSAYADDSRLDYLARGMAGVLLDVSPMTAIERLRNMKHERGGALWDERERQCRCWRCSGERYRKFEEFVRKETEK